MRTSDEGLDAGFLQRTYRSAMMLAAVLAAFLYVRGFGWAVFPVLLGAGLGLLMLYSTEGFIRRVFAAPTPDKPDKEESLETKKKGTNRALLVLALVKYVLAGGLLFWISQNWSLWKIAAFAGGIALIPLDITLRVVARMVWGERS